jgi:peptide/nickel transport system permease protein
VRNTLKNIFKDGKFRLGFGILVFLLLMIFFYPLFVKQAPLEIIGRGTFFPPGVYVSNLDSINGAPIYSLTLKDAVAKRLASKLSLDDRAEMKTYLLAIGVPEDQIDLEDTQGLLTLWKEKFDPKVNVKGMIFAKLQYYRRLNAKLESLLDSEGIILARETNGVLEKSGQVLPLDYVNIGEVSNVRLLPLGTDNFGRDVLTELVKATAVSLQIGVIAGSIATLVGLVLGLISGYIGGWVDDVIMFFTNLLIVIPSLIILILVSYSISQSERGPTTIAVVIGLTSWVWTTKAVRAQVISLRNRDHVNLSKLSGHSTASIILRDILPYIASYVVMAFILQISSAILAEASLSILGLGPKTTLVPTLGLMMNWAMIYQAHILDKWWAYFPVIVVIALITFSMNLINTSLDQIFNPALRE